MTALATFAKLNDVATPAAAARGRSAECYSEHGGFCRLCRARGLLLDMCERPLTLLELASFHARRTGEARRFKPQRHARDSHAAFEVEDLAGEFRDGPTSHGVVFTKEPTPAGPINLAVFADTCANLIQIYQRA